jgi:hypothetical protein
MLRYIDIDSLAISQTANVVLQIDQLATTRGDDMVLELQFLRGGVVQDMGAAVITFTAKPLTGNQRLDGVAIVQGNSFVKSGAGTTALYTGAPSLKNPYLDKMLGVDPVDAPEIVQVCAVADVAGSLAGMYFDLYDANGAVTVWFKVSGTGAAPPEVPGGRLEEVDFATNSSAATVASAIQAVLGADSQFTAAVVGSIVTVTAATDGERANADPGNSGFGVLVTQAGSIAFTETDIENVVLDAEIYFYANGLGQTTQAFNLFVENNKRRNGDVTPVDLRFQRSGKTPIASGAGALTVTFPALSTAAWHFIGLAISNTTDVTPLNIFPGLLSARSTTGFTLNLNGLTDTANYVLEWTLALD